MVIDCTPADQKNQEIQLSESLRTGQGVNYVTGMNLKRLVAEADQFVERIRTAKPPDG
jgi:hypothetical protein